MMAPLRALTCILASAILPVLSAAQETSRSSNTYTCGHGSPQCLLGAAIDNGLADSPGISLLQQKARLTKAREFLPAAKTTTMSTFPPYLIVSSTTTGQIYSWDFKSSQPNALVTDAGANPSGIALDRNRGHLYYTDPGHRQIVRYELAIRNGKVELYDQQPVIIAHGVDAESLLVNDDSNLFWTDPVDHSIKKMYWTTIETVAAGTIQPNALMVVSYMDMYVKLGRVVPSDCYSQRLVVPANCTANTTCLRCLELHRQPYIYQLYANLGHPSGMQEMPGNRLLWGNRVEGFTRGTVVEAEAEPTLRPGQTVFTIKALTYLWDTVINFWQMPDTELQGRNVLFLTTNGTLGIPPIPGDVVGALVAVTPTTSNGASEVVVMDTNLLRPRSIVWNGHEDLYIADDFGVRIVGSGRIMQNAPEIRQFALPGSAGLIRLRDTDPCYLIMVAKGFQPIPPWMG